MKIKDFITKDNWGKFDFAIDADGKAVPPRDATAVRFCLVGAAEKCYGFREAYWICLKMQQKLNVFSVDNWNDRPKRTFEDVKNLVEELDI